MLTKALKPSLAFAETSGNSSGQAPGAGVVITTGFAFDVPVRFNTDTLDVSPRPRTPRFDHLDSTPGDPQIKRRDRFLAAVLKELATSTAVILAA